MAQTPFYKNTRDALKDVGISARQLTYWRQEGLFTPQLKDNKRYTIRDIEELKYLKKLIDPREGYGFPVETVRRFLKTAPQGQPNILDLESGKLTTDFGIFREIVHGGRHNEMLMDMDAMEEAVLTFTLKLFTDRYLSSDDRPPVYMARRDELLDRLRQMDYVARAAWERDENGYFENLRLEPSLPGDPQFSEDQLREYALEQLRRLDPEGDADPPTEVEQPDTD